MTIQANSIWKYLRRSLTADPGRFAGGSAVSDPLGLLAVERERLTAPPRSQHRANHPAADAGLSRHVDYTADIPGGGPAVHYPCQHREFAGIMVPTRRRVYVRHPGGSLSATRSRSPSTSTPSS